MSVPGESLEERRRFLAAEIARQRIQLADAYRNLETPIRYGEYSMRGIGFFRKNAWLLVAAPTVFNLATTLFGFARRKKAPKPAPGLRRTAEPAADETRSRTWKDVAVVASRNAIRLYQLYRRIRPYFP